MPRSVDISSKPDAGFYKAIEILAGASVVRDGYPDGITILQHGVGGSGDALFLEALEEFLVERIQDPVIEIAGVIPIANDIQRNGCH
jgi:hypothetical protein